MGCEVAINAGFFNRGTGDCVGNVVSHGHRAQIAGLQNVNFGILAVRSARSDGPFKSSPAIPF